MNSNTALRPLTDRLPAPSVPSPLPAPSSRRRQRGRTLHLIDLDNLVRGSNGASYVPAQWRRYVASVGIGADDHVVFAANATLARTAMFDLAGVGQSLVARRIDGAECKLIDYLDIDFIAERYDEFIIGSGDHLFAEFAARLATKSVLTSVFARPSVLSRRLRLATTHHIDPGAATTTKVIPSRRQ